jgi:hypothetical protein
MLLPLPLFRGLCAAVCLLCAAVVNAQTPDAVVDPSTLAPALASSAPAAPATTAVAASSPPTDLRSRTRDFEPTRFNLSVRGGAGLIAAVSPYTLAPWEIGTGGSVMNFDRNPGDIDFFEYGLQVAVGLPGHVELFLRGSPILRTNSVNQDPLSYPVPPLDLVVDTYPTPALRAQPYFLFAQEVPYKSYYLNGVHIQPPGHGAFGSSSGGYSFGGKVTLFSEDEGHPFGFGIRAYAEVPSEHPSYNTTEWRKVAGVSGKTDVGADLLFAKIIGRAQLLTNVGYEHVGDPTRGLRIQYIDSSKWNDIDPATGAPASILVGAPVESKLDLRDQLMSTVGTALPAFNAHGLQFWLLSELSYTRYIGGATRVERLVHPLEMRLGIQANVPKFPSLSLGAAWQLLINDAGNGTTRQTTFVTPDGRGDINFSDNVDPGLSETYTQMLEQRGVSFTDKSSRMLSTNNAQFDASRNVPTGNRPVVAMGGGNILGFITYRFH